MVIKKIIPQGCSILKTAFYIHNQITIMTTTISTTITKSGVKLSLISVSGRLNELSFTGEFVTESELSWMTLQDSGLSSDEWRKEYSRGTATERTSYATPKLRMLQIGRGVSYTTSEIISDLSKLGLESVEELWQLVLKA